MTCIPFTTIAGVVQHSFNVCLRLTSYRDVGLPTKLRLNVGPALQPIAGSMPVNRLRRWPSTNLSPGLLLAQTRGIQCWPTFFDAGPSLKQHWVIVQCFLTAALCWWRFTFRRHKHQITRYIGPMLMWCWATVCDSGPTLFQPGPLKLLTTNIIVNIYFSEHLLKTKVLNLRIWNVILHMFIRTGVQKCEPFPIHSTPLSSK